MDESPPPITFEQANGFQRGLRRVASSGPGAWVFAKVGRHIDAPLHRLTNGRHTFAGLIGGLPVLMLTTTGAKSGQLRTTPVLGLPTSEGLAVIASNFGQERSPAWFYNLRKNPLAEATVGDQSHRVEAVEAEGERRSRIWREGLKIYPGFSQYEKRASHRDIHVFVLEPR